MLMPLPDAYQARGERRGLIYQRGVSRRLMFRATLPISSRASGVGEGMASGRRGRRGSNAPSGIFFQHPCAPTTSMPVIDGADYCVVGGDVFRASLLARGLLRL